MAQARLAGALVAQSDHTVAVGGYLYFPRDSVQPGCLAPNPRTSRCLWKGTAEYFDVIAGGTRAEGAAWSYPEPKRRAAHIAGHVAFWGAVEVTP